MSRDISLLHPYVKSLAEKFLAKCKESGLDIIITQTLRTVNEQNELYAQGRTKPGKIVTNAKGGHSMHNYGLAFDIAIKKNGVIIWDDTSLYSKAGDIGKSLGLEWGGSWRSFKDYPHFQWTGGLTLKDLLSGKRPGNNNKVSSNSSAPSLKRVLKFVKPYMKGDDILYIQKRLQSLGYDLGSADGVFGEKTKNAISAFQKSKNLSVDGIVGPKTFDALF